MIKRKLLALLSVVTIMSFVFVPVAQAQQSGNYSGGNALKVSPVRSDLTIQPGTSQAVDISVQNLTDTTANLRAIMNDFVADANETGQPSIILDEGKSAPTHSLKQYIAPIADFTLAPKEKKTLKVTVAMPPTVKAGGYFGVVRFAPVSAETDKNVTLAASVGSLILVKVPGDIEEKLSIASLDVRQNDDPGTFFTSNKDLQSVVRFQNSGNVQVEPFGKMLLKKSGKTIAEYEVNNVEPRGNVLPDSIRRFDVPLNKVGSIGKYTVEGNFGYGSNGQLLSASASFYVIPVWAIGISIGVLLLILFLVFGVPRLIRSYNQRIIRKANASGAPASTMAPQQPQQPQQPTEQSPEDKQE